MQLALVAVRDAWRRSGSWNALAGGTMYSSCEACLSCSFVILQARLARVVVAAYDSDVPGYRPPFGGGLRLVAGWVNAQPDWERSRSSAACSGSRRSPRSRPGTRTEPPLAAHRGYRRLGALRHLLW